MTPHPPAALTAPTVVHCVRDANGTVLSVHNSETGARSWANAFPRLCGTVEERVAIPREQYDALLRRIDLGNIDTDELLSEIRRRNVRLIFDGKHLYNAPTADALPSAAAGVGG